MNWKSRTLLLLFIALHFGAKANSAATGVIHYTWVSDSTYQVVFKLTNDCSGNAAPGSIQLCVLNGCNNTSFTTTMHKMPGAIRNNTKPNGAEVGVIYCTPRKDTKCTNPNAQLPGYHEWWYADTVTLPSRCNNWKFRVTYNARNTSKNIATGNMVVEAMLNNQLSLQNSSPVSEVLPNQFVCRNMPFTIELNTTDANNDSLDFVLVQPRTGSTSGCGGTPTNIQSANVNPPLNTTNNPFQTGQTFTLNSSIGKINFTSTGDTGSHTFTIRTDEYRNGVLIGSTWQDFQVYVFSCSIIGPPGSGNTGFVYVDTTIGGVSDTFGNRVVGCANQQLDHYFYLGSTDTTALISVSDIPGQTMPGATITYTGQGTDSVLIHISWKPAMIDAGRHELKLRVSDTACIPPGIVLQFLYTMYVDIPGGVATGNDTAICAHEAIRLYASKNPGYYSGSYTWQMLSGSTGTLSCNNCDVAYGRPAPTASYELTSSVPWCPVVFKDTINVSLLSTPVTYPAVNVAVSPDSNIGQYQQATFVAYNVNCTNPAYQWMKNGKDILGATGIAYSSTQLIDDDIISCRFVCNDSCPNPRDTISNAIKMNVEMGITGVNADNEVNIYPNPANDLLHIALSQEKEELLRVELSDVTGRHLFSTRLLSGTNDIDIAFLTSGVYIVTVYQGVEPLKVSKLYKL